MKFLQKNLRIGGVENLSFFESAILNFFLIFFASSRLVTIYGVPRMGRNFDDNPDFQHKARGYEIMRHTNFGTQFLSLV